MGAAIEGIGSNVMTSTASRRSAAASTRVAPDHIEIGSFMALAGVTGGELRIKDCVPEDLRMIRLVFERLGLRIELDGGDVRRARRPEARRRSATPATTSPRSRTARGPRSRPTSRRSRVALATQSEGSVLIFEKMFENRLFFVDKLISMGAEIIALRPAPGDRHRPAPAARRAAVESPDIRAGMAMLIAALCAEGTSEIDNIRQIDRGYERIDERLRALGARIERVATEPPLRRAMIHPIPSGTRDVLPDEMRELRAITDALRGVFDAARLRRGRTRRRSSTRRC